MRTSCSPPEAPNGSTLKPNIHRHALSFSCLQHFICLMHLVMDMVMYGGYFMDMPPEGDSSSLCFCQLHGMAEAWP